MQLAKQYIFFPVFIILALFSCKNDAPVNTETPAKVDTIRVAPVPAEGTVIFEVTAGTVYWSGKKALGAPHYGTIDVKGGELSVNGDRLISGMITLDMESIAVSDIKDSGEKRDLESHLKDNDFFEVKKFPTATFSFSEVLPSTMPAFNAVIVGELNMKGKKNPVNIPVKLTVNGDELMAESATFPINRTQWGVNFRSGALGTTRDKLIEDQVPLSLKLTAKKK